MHKSVDTLISIEKEINQKSTDLKYLNYKPNIVVVSKTFPISDILPLINHGHVHFGENKVQEAMDKWTDIKNDFPNLKLHMIGKLQTNKAKKAVKLFDYIHSLDNAKLALKIFQFEKELNKKVKLFIQVNLADENQKSGIPLKDLYNFYYYCTQELSLNIIGLMCLPPFNSKSEKYFEMLKNAGKKIKLKELSMGMSADFEKAIIHGATFLRLGTLILGERSTIRWLIFLYFF